MRMQRAIRTRQAAWSSWTRRCPASRRGTRSCACPRCGTSTSAARTPSVWSPAASASTSIASGTSSPATRRHYAAIYASPGAMHSAFAQFLAIDQKDEADNLKAMETKLAMPVLAIGAAKAFGSNVAVVMRNAATNVQELVVPDAGHWLMEEAPAATIAAVQDFLPAR